MIQDIQKIQIPENYVLVYMSYEQFREFFKGNWKQGLYFRIKRYGGKNEDKYFAFQERSLRVIIATKHRGILRDAAV